jgi:hypothetical protein
MTRFEKLEYLRENCSENFIKTCLLREMVAWMSEEDFSKFFSKLCSEWMIENPEDTEDEMNEFTVEYDRWSSQRKEH